MSELQQSSSQDGSSGDADSLNQGLTFRLGDLNPLEAGEAAWRSLTAAEIWDQFASPGQRGLLESLFWPQETFSLTAASPLYHLLLHR